MALRHKSLFLYGLQVTTDNSSIDFKISGGGSEIQATVALGFYSLTELCLAIASAMNVADPLNTYLVTADRSISNGTQNRVTIETSGAFLSLLFGTGTRNATTIAPLIGFTSTDHTGATSYTGTSTCGTAIMPAQILYNYISPDMEQKVFGSVNVSASGKKEAIVFDIQKFFEFLIKFEPEAIVTTDWVAFMQWAMQQRRFDFTPDISSPNNAFDVTFESTIMDGKGLGYKWTEMLSDGWPFYYQSGLIKLRQTNL